MFQAHGLLSMYYDDSCFSTTHLSGCYSFFSFEYCKTSFRQQTDKKVDSLLPKTRFFRAEKHILYHTYTKAHDIISGEKTTVRCVQVLIPVFILLTRTL